MGRGELGGELKRCKTLVELREATGGWNDIGTRILCSSEKLLSSRQRQGETWGG